MASALSEYNRKRNFKLTSEPAGDLTKSKGKKTAHALKFVIQKHDARRLHYDFRLEIDGTLKSWAIPKGPSLDPKEKRLAVHVEDHPLSYASFEGSIPHGQYGGGDVIVWDQGIWQPYDDPVEAHKNGKLKFTLIGEKLAGDWTLVRTNLRGNGDKEQWLLIKERDESARPAEEYDVVTALPQSVVSGALIKKSKSESLSKSAPIEKKSIKKTPIGLASESINSFSKSAKNTEANKKSKKIVLPEFLSPELATLVSEPPSGDWHYEIKFDGYRILARIQKGKVNLFTRNGHDWTHKLPLQAEAIAALGLEDSWLDGEVVVLDDSGLPSFQALQNAFELGKSKDILYYFFDAPFLNGRDLREEPLETRRAELEAIIPAPRKSPLRFSSAFMLDHQNILASACAMSLEGIIGKRAGSPYVSKRSGDWIKLKCRLRQEFVIVGYTKPQGSRSGFGALLVAVHETMGKPELRYAGRIGTGFDRKGLEQLYDTMKKLERDSTPLSHKLQSSQMRGVQWVEPKLICEAEFAQWTSEGILRQAAFVALRTDKPVRDIIREQARLPSDLPPPEKIKKSMTGNNSAPIEKIIGKHTSNASQTKQKKSVGDNQVFNIKITHPDRIVDPDSKSTKKDVAVFYNEISNWILPHLNDRPVSLLRVPEGIDGEQFFQKHVQHLSIPNIKQLDRALDPGHAALMEIDSTEALVGAVQMGTIELHTWGAKVDHIETPDRITLDLDPDPALPWRSMIEATRLTLAVLDELKLDAFLKTTGGKGIHIVIPLKPDAEWEYVKEFSKAIAQFMSRQIPERFVAKMGPKNRIGKIFIDYLRNQRGASAVSAYSVRARSGLPVSVPITKDELMKLTSSAQWNIGNLHQRLERLKTDPWEDYKNSQTITQAMWKKLDANRP
ncbi:ATP-dependent DNA ligase [Cellvibrio zantedeschiae]|uniref:DNA ligase (ATP) n=1 Tax=Cellvibrio zantedeschiae TaxID=1237077 RepID=A0ABQ3AYJ5_9GAMM|nr:DNA ligase D [Cellvibrio zantedeschiae]GGY71809.1 ATP-dependent DNA ligase [Cellvibrio zantedeschiae]